MKNLIFAALIAAGAPVAASQSIQREAMDARCAVLIDFDRDRALLRPEINNVYSVMSYTIGLMYEWWEQGRLPYEDICDEDPTLSVEEALKMALDRAMPPKPEQATRDIHPLLARPD